MYIKLRKFWDIYNQNVGYIFDDFIAGKYAEFYENDAKCH